MLLHCRDVETALESASLEHVLEQLKKSKRKLLPVVDSQGILVSIGRSTCNACIVGKVLSCESSRPVVYVK